MAAHLEKREKRWVPLVVGGARVAWSVGRALMRGAARGGITRSGSRITQHYNRNGSYRTALRNFSNLKPTNVRPTTSRVSKLFILHPCDPTVMICYLIWPCDTAVHITYLISHSSSLSFNTVIKGYFSLSA